MKRNLLLIILTISMNIYSKENTIPYAETNELNLCEEWDKTFPRSNRVTHKKVVFVNRFGITLAADLYAPVFPRKAVCHAAWKGDQSAEERKIDA